MKAREGDVLQYIDDHADQFVQTFQDLVRIPSTMPPGDTRQMADACADIARSLGMEVERFEPAEGHANNIARLRGAVGEPVLLFNSHLDTHPPGEEAEWKYPPLAGEIHDGIVWGVGTRDMKAGLSAALLAIQTLQDCGITFRGDVLLTHTADHISGRGDYGLRYLIENDLIKADYGVYTEANPPAKVEIASRGMVRMDVVIYGYAKHTKYKVEPSTSGKPINAVLKATKAIVAIEEMSFSNWQPHEFIPGPPVISINKIEGGFSFSLVPDRCILMVDCRTLPGQSPETVVTDVRGVLDAIARDDPEFRYDVSVTALGEPCEIDPNEPIVLATQSAIRRVVGSELPLSGVGSTSDMRFIVNDAKIPMCKFMFPSSETGANEHESIDDFLNTVKVYALLMLDQVC